MHNGGENFCFKSNGTELATLSVQLAADCFRMRKTVNRFLQLCRLQSPVSLSPAESSTETYSSISLIETEGTEELGPSSHTELLNHEDCDFDKDEDAYVCEINANDHYRLCKARAAHGLVLSKPDTFLANKTLSVTAAPHLRGQDLIIYLANVAKVVELDVPTILQEKLKDPMLSIVRSWIEGSFSLDVSAPAIRQSKGVLRYGQGSRARSTTHRRTWATPVLS